MKQFFSRKKLYAKLQNNKHFFELSKKIEYKLALNCLKKESIE